MGSHFSCSNCSLTCHQKCQESTGTICGAVGLIKLSTVLQKIDVLDLGTYSNFLRLVKEDNFEILLAASKTLAEIEENLITSLLPALRYDYLPFLKLALRSEIEESNHPSTLFRGNTFCTKVLFSFTSQLCSNYLNKTLENNLLQIVNSKRSFEIDESKFDEAYKKHWGLSQCNVANNLENLSNFLEILIKSIFESAALLPR